MLSLTLTLVIILMVGGIVAGYRIDRNTEAYRYGERHPQARRRR